MLHPCTPCIARYNMQCNCVHPGMIFINIAFVEANALKVSKMENETAELREAKAIQVSHNFYAALHASFRFVMMPPLPS